MGVMTLLNFDGIVFDLDATLVNIGGFVEWGKVQEEIVDSYLESGCNDETVKTCSAKGVFNMLDEMYMNLIDEMGEMGAKDAQDNVYEIISSYEVQGVEACILMDGCVSTIEWIYERGVPMGICTSNSTKAAVAALKQQGLENYFRAVVGRTVGLPMKPHPAQLEKCFRMMGVSSTKGVVVGDSHKDIIAGKSVGAYTVGIPVYFTRLDLMKDAGVDVIIDSLHQLPGVLEGL